MTIGANISNSDESKRTKPSQEAKLLLWIRTSNVIRQYNVLTNVVTLRRFQNKYNRNAKMSDETVLKSYEGTNMMSITGNLGYPHRRSKTTRWFSLPNSMDSTIDEVPSKDNFSEVKEPDHYNSMYRI
ncbi:hypothetical protein RIR_jg35384.t2 [Rhizophagus irregularis DAOM 181602=DAOM 197198]|nr:hypothetical protein RIR_jg35384.t2 [Rhizophagus irregularis DAOM 181602=DAOM 197198]